MTALGYTFLAWVVITAGFIGVMVYKGRLSMHETDQLFLDENANHDAEIEHDELVRRETRLAPIWKAMAGACAISTIALASMYIITNI